MGIVFTTTKIRKTFDQSGPELLKQAIARVACSYLSDYDTVFINSSSTALNILHYLKADHLTIVTNNLKLPPSLMFLNTIIF